MRTLALVISVIAISAVSASAADLAPRPYTKAPPMVDPVYNWNGFYIGVNGGGGWGRSNWAFTGVGTFTNHDISGGFAGGTIGYNWQMNPNWVFGLEADGDWANINGSAPCPNPAFNCTSNVRDLASFRGRVGYAAGPVLFYGTGGAAYANVNYSALTFVGGAPPFAGGVTGTGLFSDDRWGYAAGAGIEWGFMPNWSAKVEYMHYGFGNDTAPAGTLAVVTPVSLRLNVDTVKAGVNYHFNWGGPVAARY
jgi:outer membrane immunogenic protein